MTLIDDLNDAFLEGMRAANAGQDIDSCPYSYAYSAELRCEWLDGFASVGDLRRLSGPEDGEGGEDILTWSRDGDQWVGKADRFEGRITAVFGTPIGTVYYPRVGERSLGTCTSLESAKTIIIQEWDAMVLRRLRTVTP